MSQMEAVGSDGRPLEGSTWEDAQGRLLYVAEVEPADPDGRQVRGEIFPPSEQRPTRGNGEKYTTDLLIWQKVWRDKTEAGAFRQ